MQMHRTFAAVLTAALLVTLVGVSTGIAAHPKPSAVPTRPELTFEPGELRLRQSERDGKWYWYMTYEVSNYTGKDRIWAPTFILFTDRGDLLESGRGVRREIPEEFIAYLGDEMLETQHQMIGDLRQGEGNKRTGLIVWPAPNLDVNELSVFTSGISSETAVIKHPVTGKDQILQKTLMREYLISGDATALGDAPVGLHPDVDRAPRWIFR